ncbi:MAG: alpha/beta hydrolase-fold protein [Flavobacteriaceae bacterium]
MKRITITLCFLLVISTIFSQTSKVKLFNSTELGVERILKIHIPKSYKSNSDRVYPLTIVLDSEFLFDVYVANAKLYSDKDKAPEQIIVGISQNQKRERYKDCSYDKVSSMPTNDGTVFYRFLRNEVLDYMDANYNISPFKTIVGNTLTANFINYFLIEKEPAFQAYINLDPNYAQDMQSMFHGKIPTIDEAVYYYIASGDFNSDKKEETLNAIDDLLQSSKNENFNYRFDAFENATKESVIGQGISSALAFVFDQYSAISKEEYKSKVSKLTPPEAIEYLERKYVEIEYLFGANIKIRERDIYAVEEIIIDKENGDYLEDYGKMINRLYPNSPLGDYYIGLYFEKGKSYKKALKYYKNGFAKISADDPNKDGYYANVERIIALYKNRKNEPVEDEIEEDEEDEDEEKKE